MSSPAPCPRPGRDAGRRRARAARAALRFLLDFVRRTYAVAVIVLIAWVSYLAFRYLVVTLIFPTAAPAQIVGLPTRFTEAVLRSPRSEWLGVAISETPRTPLAHYHRLDGWIQPDPSNGCTRSGCHAPLPHARRKEVRAFLNMHATSLHCGVCHVESADRPLRTTWYDLTTGDARHPPTVLEAYAWLESPAGQAELATPGPAQQRRLVGLLRRAAREADEEPSLLRLADAIAAVRAPSDEFQELVARARATLPRQFRGEYGAKLALRDAGTERPVLDQAGAAAAVREFLAVGLQLDPEQRRSWVPRLHPAQRMQALHCTDCHREHESLIDFAAAGYPEARRISLFRAPIFQTIEHISAGRPLHLPQFIESKAPQD